MSNIKENKRKGISTILGTIIFIGILFTSIIPMYISMSQADTYAIQKQDELEKSDLQRLRESCIVYLYPTGPSAPKNLTVMAVNSGPEIVKIVRVWLSDQYFQVSGSTSIIGPYESRELMSINPNPIVGDTYEAYLTSDRGNVFTNEGASITYVEYNINGTGGWGINEYLLNVLINAPKPGTYQIDVYRKSETGYGSTPFASAQPVHNGGSTLQVFKIPMETADYKVVIRSGSYKFTGFAHVLFPGLNIYWVVSYP